MNLSSYLKVLEAGGWALWFILFMAVLAMAVAAERLANLWRFMDRARTLTDTVNRCIQRGATAEGRTACERSRSPLAEVFLVGFERQGRTSETNLEQAVDRARQRVYLDLKNRLWLLGTVGATAPFIGLFGTVIGIMAAFKAISERGGGGFTVVAPGIAEALITTAAGIAVAVQAVMIYNYFNQRLARVAVETKLLVEEFLETLRSATEKETTDGARQAS